MVACSGASSSDSAGPVKEITLEPEQLHFESVQIGTVRTRELLATNTGTVDLALWERALSSGNERLFTFGEEELLLAPGESGTLSVSFAPSDRGLHRALTSLVFGADDASFIEGVAELLGFGEEAEMDVQPNPLRLDDLYAGCEVDGSLTLENTGTLDLVIEALDFSHEDFSLVDAIELPSELAVGDNVNLTLRFAPQSGGTVSESLGVTTDRTTAEGWIYATVYVYESRVDVFTAEAVDAGGCESRFALTAEPRPETVVVSVADERQEDGWTIDGNTLVFEDAIDCGTSVEVAYETQPVCG